MGLPTGGLWVPWVTYGLHTYGNPEDGTHGNTRSTYGLPTDHTNSSTPLYRTKPYTSVGITEMDWLRPLSK
jgi:hypothetical protein